MTIRTDQARQVGKVDTSSPAVAQATRVLSAARKHIGEAEGPNNKNPYTQQVMGDAHQPWCAAFVSSMIKEAGIPGLSGKIWSASTAQLAGQFQSMGRYIPRGTQQPQPGDVIFFGGRGGEHHTGIVQKVENGKVYTIEGNSSDKVSERVYDLNDPSIGGYGRVADGQVPADLGFDTSGATRGNGGTPHARAKGAGSAGRAHPETNIDPASYFRPTRVSLAALLAAIARGDFAAVAAALGEMMPSISEEDVNTMSELLMKNPELSSRLEAQPELLQQLALQPTQETVDALMKLPAPEKESQGGSRPWQGVNQGADLDERYRSSFEDPKA